MIWLTGAGPGAPLYALLVACFYRPLFLKERLHYMRELKSGVSAVGFWLAKMSYSTCSCRSSPCASLEGLGYLRQLCSSSFWEYSFAYGMLAWFWSGAALAVSTHVSSPRTLILIFWPMFEQVIQGSALMGTTVRESPLLPYGGSVVPADAPMRGGLTLCRTM